MATDNYALPLPPDSLLVKDAPKMIRDANTAVDAALTEHGTRVENAERAATAAGRDARAAAELVDAPADAKVAALINGASTATAKAMFAARNGAFLGPMRAWGAALAARDTAPAIWVSLGSSTALGMVTSDDGQAWAGRIATWLTGKGIKAGALGALAAGPRPATGVHCYTGAVGATTSETYLTDAKVALIRDLRPALITHMVGANDYHYSVPLATYKANLRGWLDKLNSASPDTVHLLIHQQGRRDPGPGTPWADYGTAMAEVADLYPNVAFVNAGQKFGAAGFPSYLVGDGSHTNITGHRLLADIVSTAMGCPIQYGPQETYATANMQGGGFTATAKTWASVLIPAAPYPRRAKAQIHMFTASNTAENVQSTESTVRAAYTDKGEAVGKTLIIRHHGGGILAANTQHVSPSWLIEANRAAEISVLVTPGTYLSSADTYNDFHVVVDPA